MCRALVVPQRTSIIQCNRMHNVIAYKSIMNKLYMSIKNTDFYFNENTIITAGRF